MRLQADFSELQELQDDIRQLVSELPGELNSAMTDAGEDMKQAVEQKQGQLVGTVTGNYKGQNKLKVEAGNTVSAEVKNTAKHAHLIEYGTGPRSVKSKKVLYSSREGKFFGRSVAPMPELAPFRTAFDENEGRISSELSKQILDMIEGRLVR